MRPSFNERLIVALDVETLDQAHALVELLHPPVRIFKVGSRLFTREGPKVITMITKQGGKVFLDLKYHDIPSVVAAAVQETVRFGVFMLTLHTSGGRTMLQEAVKAAKGEALKQNVQRPFLFGVTVLTSLDEVSLREVTGTPRSLEEQVLHLAKLAEASGLDGVIASPLEVVVIRKACRRGFLIVTPGIRPQGSVHDDQKRTLTPGEAIRAGADYLVIGRPIIDAPDPAAAAQKILDDLAEALKNSS